MSHLVYFLADLYPWWGLPLAFIFGEMANRYRRRGDRQKMVVYMSAAVVLLALGCAYFLLNGVERLRPAMEELEKTYLSK